MNTKKKFFSICFVLALSACVIAGCDIYKPQTYFRVAIPKDDFIYNLMFSHLKDVLEQNGYELEVVYTDRNVEANRLVAIGEADLGFVNNLSSHIVEALGPEAGSIRTILPMSQRALLGFSREPAAGEQPVRQLLEDKVLGVEILRGEGHQNIESMLSKARIPHAAIVQSNSSQYDVRLIWGSLYGKRALEMLDSGWHVVSLGSEFIEFQTLTDPALEGVKIPALPGDQRSKTIQTIATDAVLIANKEMGEHAAYRLVEAILQGKLAFVRKDPMYRSITEAINLESLLYPLHKGTSSYLRRDTPAFLERYADALALILSLIVLLYGIVQAVKSHISQIKKDRIDMYFLEFLDIRSQAEITSIEQIQKLNDLFQRALLQMTAEKMEKGDFDIFSRLIQQELTILRLNITYNEQFRKIL